MMQSMITRGEFEATLTGLLDSLEADLESIPDSIVAKMTPAEREQYEPQIRVEFAKHVAEARTSAMQAAMQVIESGPKACERN